jgi:hypothetical protein
VQTQPAAAARASDLLFIMLPMCNRILQDNSRRPTSSTACAPFLFLQLFYQRMGLRVSGLQQRLSKTAA